MKDRIPPALDVFATIAAMGDCRTPQEVGALLVAALAPFGLANYAIGGMPTPTDPNPTSFMYHNWPEDWQRLYFERNFAAVDPVPRAAMASAMPLTIGEMRAGKAGFVPGPEADDYFAAGDELVGGKGLIVPIHGPHGYHGIAVLVGKREDFGIEDRARLQALALHAHGRMLDLFGGVSDAPLLTPREVEVLRQARAGMGDEGIARALGISARTVRFHFENARRKLGVKTRSEALITAVGRHLLGS
jgi:DNA-binding CsgD family transcriptional regulator